MDDSTFFLYHKFDCARNILQIYANLWKNYLPTNMYYSMDIIKYKKYYYMRWMLQYCSIL